MDVGIMDSRQPDARDIRLSRSILLEAMLLGVAISKAGDAKKVCDALISDRMTAVTSRQLLDAIKTRDKSRFAKIMKQRYGVVLKESESAVEGLLRNVLLRQSSEIARETMKWIIESVHHTDSLGDIAEKLEECLVALRNVVKVEESLKETGNESQ